ncbi:hypothetical protein L9F63_005870, partial [Diploptera punctata]
FTIYLILSSFNPATKLPSGTSLERVGGCWCWPQDHCLLPLEFFGNVLIFTS